MNTQIQEKSNLAAPTFFGARSDVSPRYLTVPQFAKCNPAFTAPAIRNLIFRAEPRESTKGTIPGNGLLEAGAIVRIGRKVLINEERFFAWVEAQGGAR